MLNNDDDDDDDNDNDEVLCLEDNCKTREKYYLFIFWNYFTMEIVVFEILSSNCHYNLDIINHNHVLYILFMFLYFFLLHYTYLKISTIYCSISTKNRNK